MTADELQDKVAKFPVWAREYIRRLELQAEPYLDRIADLSRKVGDLERRYQKFDGRASAMEAILTCAARGGHETAQAYVERIISEYDDDRGGDDTPPPIVSTGPTGLRGDP